MGSARKPDSSWIERTPAAEPRRCPIHRADRHRNVDQSSIMTRDAGLDGSRAPPSVKLWKDVAVGGGLPRKVSPVVPRMSHGLPALPDTLNRTYRLRGAYRIRVTSLAHNWASTQVLMTVEKVMGRRAARLSSGLDVLSWWLTASLLRNKKSTACAARSRALFYANSCAAACLPSCTRRTREKPSRHTAPPDASSSSFSFAGCRICRKRRISRDCSHGVKCHPWRISPIALPQPFVPRGMPCAWVSIRAGTPCRGRSARAMQRRRSGGSRDREFCARHRNRARSLRGQAAECILWRPVAHFLFRNKSTARSWPVDTLDKRTTFASTAAATPTRFPRIRIGGHGASRLGRRC